MFILKKWYLKRKMKRKYIKYLENHKRNVIKAFYQLAQCKDLQWLIFDEYIIGSLWDRVLTHDNDKFHKETFEPYRIHYFPIDAEEWSQNEDLFLSAWEKHIKNNDHHWQNRQHWKDEDFNINTELACLENILDWMALCYDNNDHISDYYDNCKKDIHISKKQKSFIDKIIYEGIDKNYILSKNK